MNLWSKEYKTIHRDLLFTETKKPLGEIPKEFKTKTQKGHVIRMIKIPTNNMQNRILSLKEH